MWDELSITVRPEAAEAVEFALNSLDASGTSIDLMPAASNNVCVVGYFEKIPDDETIQDEIHYALRSYGLDENVILSVERREIENTDWLAEWKKHWKPTMVGNFVVAAPWHKVDGSGNLVIRIEPNMAFGTGTHETTQLCLQTIDEVYETGDSFLDVGTGTGILAIAAALKGRNPSYSEGVNILGFDTDADAVQIAIENAKLNGVGSKIEFHVGAIDESISAFDFVCANLTLDVILPTLQLLLSKAKRYLVLSGILKTQEAEIASRLNDLPVGDLRIETAGEWISVAIKKEI